MAGTYSLAPEFRGGGDQPERPRKRLRKGTRSCWECKRRKVRCMFAGAADVNCQGCRRRGTACISQDLPDDPGPSGHASNTVGLEERLGRVEALVEHLAAQLVKEGIPEEIEGLLLRDRLGKSTSSTLGIPGPPLSPRPLILLTAITCVQDTSVAVKFRDLSQRLIEAWPSQHDLDILLDLPVGNSGLVLNKACCVSPSQPATPRDMLQLPPPGSHPVLIGGKLLLLGIFLQGLGSGTASAEGLSSGCRDIMSRAVEAAGLVTTHDELASSLEGIECIMMESMYHDMAGNARGAWVTIRRAMTMAQMIGLHRGSDTNLSSLNREQVWFRLVQTDRYISLLLGLPQGSSDNIFATPTALDNLTPIEKMRRLDCLAAGRILQLTTSERTNPATTHSIDVLLQRASAQMPPRWWLAPNLTPSSPASTSSLLDQFTHFNLLFRLHLPYLLHLTPFSHTTATTSKIICLAAIRELLTRFLALDTLSDSPQQLCRGMARFAYTAAAALCIAHLAAAADDSLTFLAHQRQGDLGLVERIVDCLELDEEEGRMAGVLRALVGMVGEERDDGIGCYGWSLTTSLGAGDEGVEIGRVEDRGRVVRVWIPHFGVVEVRRENVSQVCGGVEGQGAADAPELPMAGSDVDDWGLLGGMDDVAFEDVIRGFEEPGGMAAQDQWVGWSDRGPS
ncbi:hypothetical protein C8A05DRAFT_14502 [Staphylotrichum tortipilum]|uniref:Zn(2)-C6 fungal-type domain-containing protein n=1 Tax=Staphylotrichum tortipilum TaxID=2831512 RepID=A0AAN6MMV0_9PEZI|nr:hypothetical protein C8A05DRAFT_14502 [Staphylotrichum longicolle]